MAADLLLALLADARLPVGAHTQSGGLEPAMTHGGLRAADVPRFLVGRLATCVPVDAGTAVVARSRGLGDPVGLPAVEEAWAARTPSAPLRAAARVQGRGYLRMASRLWPDPLWAALGREPARPVVLGVLAALAGLDAARLVRLVAHDDVATVTAAALKLDPADPVEAARWTLQTHDRIEALVPRLARLTDPEQIPASSAPLLEEFSLLHTRTDQRLFHA
ncbi:urease accessory protein UreF [Kineococcus gynurae]|uniref:Urease accessory protein UreF n=1 Tax=Kineococcus gynurae TaxID=452979 RepID=A0ABV5LW47_9ACTN